MLGATIYNLFAMHSYVTNEPIYALATPYAPSALAIIRASGDNVISLLAPFFSRKKSLLNAESGTLVHGYITDKAGEKVDEVVTAIYRKGHGYTGEEAFEITCHGSLAGIRKIMLTLREAGFREALPGEFTFRAFMHGRMDLTQAEAVEEIIKSRSMKGQQLALERLEGRLGKALSDIRERLLFILASLEVQLDYAEDEIPEDWAFPTAEVENIENTLEKLSATYDASRLYRDGAKVVLAGAANAGKSSLFNLLVKEERAIVSPVPGTTRDFIEAWCEIGGFPVRLYDTAGLRESGDIVEEEGIRRSERLIREADIVIYLVDPAFPVLPSSVTDRMLLVWSKDDEGLRHEGLSISSVTGEGISALIDEVVKRLSTVSNIAEGELAIDSRRQKDDIEECIEALEEAKRSSSAGYDIIALCFQQALSAIGRITGEFTSEELLDKLFSEFCVGK